MEKGTPALTGNIKWRESTPAISPDQIGGKPQSPEQPTIIEEKRQDYSFIQLLKTMCQFFISLAGIPFAAILRSDRVEHHKIDSMGFRSYCTKVFYDQAGEPPTKQEINRLLEVLEAEAIYNPDRHQVCLRVARHADSIYIDLADADYRVVRITSAGWSVITSREALKLGVRFIRTSRMAPLPHPITGGSLLQLKKHLNLANESDFILLVSWLVGANQPEGPFPILTLQGEHGSGKSHIARKLSDLIDPSVMPLCSYPRSERDLFIAGERAWMLSFDNLSSITPNLADAFCRMATGGGFATRQLYSDDGEKIFSMKRPMVLNGISDLTQRHDLADREIVINTRPIPKEMRQPESVLQQLWEQDRPGILGALCDAISAAMRNYSEVQLEYYPRMADFSRWVCAAESALPWEKGQFAEAYDNNRANIVEIGLESDLIGSAVINFMSHRTGWEGTPRSLLTDLTLSTSDQIRKLKDWPKQPNILSGKLRRSATFLREKNIDLDWIKSGDRKILIRRIFSPEPPAAIANNEWAEMNTGVEVNSAQNQERESGVV